MATRVITRLEDDVDGSPASETVSFAIDGASYEIDLSTKNASALRDALTTWVSAARKIGGRTRRSAKSDSFTEVDNHAVRAWAASHGIVVSSRGRIAADVIEQYRKAGN